ncbi:hypothetical protein BCR34DRAFT_638237 [Clohesyomyces aquaticus]|uniref:CorA-like transporter domain-containing protein n=1 Tax=Clohesyomyces aquaticus TaxID=1231657 RepID=A0A1Y1YQI2_9PLEO|nr:hypothetical protein BCR34DRAFT_638237 [Clohesyomyces aquaticus]
MPAYLEFILEFGARNNPTDARFSGVRDQIVLHDPTPGPIISALGRSGRHFQLCYSLSRVRPNEDDEEGLDMSKWVFNQAAVYHRFDVDNGTVLWVVTQAGLDLQQRYKILTGPNGRPEDKTFDTPIHSLRSSLSAHLMYCHWSTESWHGYLRAIHAECDRTMHGAEYSPLHIEWLQEFQEKASVATMVIKANSETVASLRLFYTRLENTSDLPDSLREKAMMASFCNCPEPNSSTA